MITILKKQNRTSIVGQVDRDASRKPTVPAPRIHYFDWLRAIAVLGVIVYHTLLPFARNTWPIQNAEQSETLQVVLSLFETFGLAVLFLIAGASVRFALQRRSMRSFFAERAKRLLVPFVVGSLVLIPPTSYIIGFHTGTVSGSFFAFLIAYPGIIWTNNIKNAGLSPEILTYVGMHLWFLVLLFICSALALPIFAFLSSSVGRSCVDKLGHLARWRGATLLLAVPITLPKLVLFPLSSVEQGWSLEAYTWYAIIFVVGYLLYSDERIVSAARRDLGLALTVAVLSTTAFIAGILVLLAGILQFSGAMSFIMLSLIGITGWSWTLTVLGFGMRVAFMQRPLPPRFGEVALPAYVLHFPIVMAITFLVVQWPLGLGAKILINALLGAGATLLVAAAVLRFPLLRPLLGLRRPVPSTLHGLLERIRDLNLTLISVTYGGSSIQDSDQE